MAQAFVQCLFVFAATASSLMPSSSSSSLIRMMMGWRKTCAVENGVATNPNRYKHICIIICNIIFYSANSVSSLIRYAFLWFSLAGSWPIQTHLHTHTIYAGTQHSFNMPWQCPMCGTMRHCDRVWKGTRKAKMWTHICVCVCDENMYVKLVRYLPKDML